VDMAAMIHSGSLPEGKRLGISAGGNGCVVKDILFKGVSAHAGGAPHMGVNALYAATCAMNAANALRETFLDHEHLRFHPIITEGGTAVNAIPERVRMESYVRGAHFEAIESYNHKINRAIAASAAAMGAQVELHDRTGYFPLNHDKTLAEAIAQAMETVAGPDTVIRGTGWDTGCTDMGDISSVIPAVHPHSGGTIGKGHGMDYYVDDAELACVLPAKCLTVFAGSLLCDDAALAHRVIAQKQTKFASKEEYFAMVDHVNIDKDAVCYHEDGTVTLDF